MQIFQKILKYSLIGGLFIIPFIPFIVPNGMFFPFISGKGFIFRILIEVLFGLYAILAFIDPEYRPKNSWLTKSVLLFTVAVFVTDVFGVNAYKSLWSNYERMEGFVLIAHLALFYLVTTSVFNSKSKWNQYFTVSIVASVFMSIYGIFQIVGKVAIDQGSFRVDGTFGNATYLAIYLVFHIFLCLYFIIDSTKPKWQRWSYGLAGILNLGILYFTATRGSILGLIGGLIISGLILVFKEKENAFLKKIAYTVILAIFVISGLFLVVRNTSFVQSNPVLSRFSFSISEIKTQGRYFVWPMAIKGFIEKPILGWGQENFNFVFNKYYDPRMYGQEQWFDRTHDVFLDWLIAGGLVGFLAYAGLYVALFYYIWRKDSLLKLSEKSVFTGMISAYIFHNIFVFDNLVSYLLFFSILAYIHSISMATKSESGKFHTAKFSNDIIYYVVVPFVVILTSLGVYFINVPALLANVTLIQAMTPQKQGGIETNLKLFNQVYGYNSFGSTEATEQLVQVTTQLQSAPPEQVPQSIKQEFYNLSKTKIEEKVAQIPTDARYLVFAGSFFNRFKQYDLAIDYLNRAIVQSPKKQTIYFELASTYLSKGDNAKAFELFKKAYDQEPSATESKILYAIGAIYTNNAAVLNEMSTKIDEATIISDNRFIQAYASTGNYNNVIGILNARIAKDPTNKQNKLSLASTYLTIGQKQKSIDIINAMISQDPSFKTEGEGYLREIQNAK